ncbi:H-2 class II histocompatibility antigen gamma chain-like protein [Labeo rohita]|uniref:H-2 class II histocompatibility antigen gamma chain-like protein n=1 Tax=Labeo rohita TaxID=84645 RepID=A0A498MXZ3_LABRO|nr:H-2 class II histocompatibility antigen gamma chain-like protein [Labeo rohita]
MDHSQDEALLQRVPSQDNVVNRSTGSSNAKALKVTGLTVLACLLLAGQALTAYLVWGQKEHINALTTGQEKLKTELTRKMSAAPPKAMHLPMNSMPLLKDFSDESSDQPSTKKKSSIPLTVVVGGRADEECKTADRKRDLQDLLRQEMDLHLTDGRSSVQRNQERVNRITQLKEEIRLQETHRDSSQSHATSTADHEKLLERRMRLRETHQKLIENELMKMERELQEEQIGGVEGEMSYLRRERRILVLQIEALRRENQQAYADLENQSRQHQQEINNIREESLQADHEKLLERRMRLRETHQKLIENELMKMERELQEEQIGGVEGEMSYLRRERRILVLQIEALRRENQQAYADLENQSRQHQQEINNIREESLQVFRAFREVLEEQRQMSERRYRNLLLDAVQDAVHLSSQNLQLREEIQQLRKSLNPTP